MFVPPRNNMSCSLTSSLMSAYLTNKLIQTALFNFQSLLLFILLIICTSAYAHSIMPGIMDRNQNGYGICLLSYQLPSYSPVKMEASANLQKVEEMADCINDSVIHCSFFGI